MSPLTDAEIRREQVARAQLMMCGVYRHRASVLNKVTFHLCQLDPMRNAEVIEVLDKTVQHYLDLADNLQGSVTLPPEDVGV